MAFVVDAAVFVLVVKVLAGESPPWPDLRGGAVLAGVGIGVVRVLGTSVVAGSATRNPVARPEVKAPSHRAHPALTAGGNVQE